MNKVYDVIIVGGGLSGLVIARELHLRRPELSFLLLEASDRFGGRLCNDSKKYGLDMGGAWVWPHVQKRIYKYITEELDGIHIFPQPGGNNEGSYRIRGGAVSIINRILADVPSDKLFLNSPVGSIHKKDKNLITHLEPKLRLSDKSQNCECVSFCSKKIVIAAPPRVIIEQVAFFPALHPEKEMAMRASNTWMAGVTKVTLIYEARFWPIRDQDDLCNIGLWNRNGKDYVAFQVYDASDENEEIFALTFFALVTNAESLSPVDPNSTLEYSARNDHVLAKQCASQLAEIWQEIQIDQSSKEGYDHHQLLNFVDHDVKRWPIEQFVSENPCPSKIMPHPSPKRALASNDWSNRLLFTGTETDMRSPGVMEGSIGAAKRVLGFL